MKVSGFWIAIVVVGAFVLRVWNLSAQPLDIDEFSEIQVQHKSYVQAAYAADSMPPLYPVLLKATLSIWPNDMAGRWLSAMVGVAAVWVVATLWGRAFGHPLALATAALLAISPLHIYYSQYIRSYGLMMFWTALVIATLALAVKTKRKTNWIWFALSALGGLYTHYYFAIFLAVLSLTFAIWAYGWKWSRQWWVINICIGVLALPLISFVGTDLHFQKSLRDSRPLDVPALGYTYVSMMTGYSIGPSKRDLQVFDRMEALQSAAPVAAVVGAIFLVFGLAGIKYLHERHLLSVFLVLALLPILAIGALGYLADVTYNPRFVVWSLLPLLGLLASGIVQGHRSWTVRAATLMLILVSGTALFNRQFVARHQNEDVRSLGACLQEQKTPSRQVFVLSNYMNPLVAHYLPSDWQVVELPLVEDTEVMESAESLVPLAEKVLRQELPDGGDFWLVYTREFHGDPAGKILEMLTEQTALERVDDFAGIVLYRGILTSTN